MKAGYNQTQIAEYIGVHKATISRELSRNRGMRGYRPQQAEQFALERRQDKVQPRIHSSDWAAVETLLEEQWSPEQISGWLLEEDDIEISHEWIYLYVYKDKAAGGDLYRHLRCQRQRKKRYGTYSTRGLIPGRISIDERPAIVDSRQRLGDWELDTIIGKAHKQAIVSLTERKSKLTLIAKVTHKTADLVGQAIVRLLKPLQTSVHTLTSDNGKEFAQHEAIADALNADFYFAHPYASWERGLNENTNGLIRQYFPKSCDFTKVTDKAIQQVMEKLNNRPRKTLGFKTPNQIFFGINPPVALAT
jgi:IS30 family transposase